MPNTEINKAPTPVTVDTQTIEMLSFCAHMAWDAERGGTTVLGTTPEQFTDLLNKSLADGSCYLEKSLEYPDYCMHMFIDNTTPTLQGVVDINHCPESAIRNGYEKRREEELAYLTRWAERFDIEVPRACYLDAILYSREQCAREGIEIKADWGIVTILGVPTKEQSPPTPMTMMRNQLGIAFGGNGTEIDPALYEKAVEYWSKWIIVK